MLSLALHSANYTAHTLSSPVLAVSLQPHPLASNGVYGNPPPAASTQTPSPVGKLIIEEAPAPWTFHRLSPEASQLSDPAPLPYLGVAKQTKSRDLGLGEDLPGGEVRGWASPWLLSPFGAFLVPLCLILSLPISRLLGQPHQGSRVTWSEIWGHIKGTSAKTLRLCKELTETYCRKSRRVVIYSKSVA